jgi:hypothetical protein
MWRGFSFLQDGIAVQNDGEAACRATGQSFCADNLAASMLPKQIDGRNPGFMRRSIFINVIVG